MKLLITSLIAYVGSINALPSELLYQNKPIDSLCLFQASQSQLPVDLRHCGVTYQHYLKLKKSNQQLTQDGYIGFDYQPSAQQPSQGSSYYRVIGKLDHSTIVKTVNQTGGTGDFTGLFKLKRQGNTLQLTPIAVGDRCNGGITEASIKNNTLQFSTNLTSFDLFALSKPVDIKLNAYADLASCAVCCIGQAQYSIHGNSPKILIGIDLGKEWIVPNQSSQGKYQFCFESQLLAYQHAKGPIIKASEIKDLMQQFVRQCLH